MHSVVDLQVILVYGEIMSKNSSRINVNIPSINPDSSLINDRDFIIETSQAGIVGIVFVSISNTIYIYPSHAEKPNESI